MAPIVKKKTWSEINRARKEERKKWREQNLMKKVEKMKLKQITESPTAVLTNTENVSPEFISTVSIAVPGSILENAQSQELRAYVAGQIARAACIFQIDEVVVFDDYANEASAKTSTLEQESGLLSARQSCIQFGRILQYLECPQYLRKHFFPLHKDLKHCGLLNPINAPHHLGINEEFPFREGVVLNKPVKNESGSYVNVGLLKDVKVDKALTPGLRCTVKLSEETSKKLKGTVVSPRTPRQETGVYWGYSIRIATSFSKVFSQCPYNDGYDLTIGTSDKGTSIDAFHCPQYKHLLIMFGGLQGLEAALENDSLLNTDDPRYLFDYYLNMLPNQGSKTVRTEEAVLISLAALRPKLNPKFKTGEYTGNILLENNLEEKDKSNVTGMEDEMARFD